MDKNKQETKESTPGKFDSSGAVVEIKVGGICPDCKLGILDCDDLLNLVCPTCGYTAGGCFT